MLQCNKKSLSHMHSQQGVTISGYLMKKPTTRPAFIPAAHLWSKAMEKIISAIGALLLSGLIFSVNAV